MGREVLVRGGVLLGEVWLFRLWWWITLVPSTTLTDAIAIDIAVV